MQPGCCAPILRGSVFCVCGIVVLRLRLSLCDRREPGDVIGGGRWHLPLGGSVGGVIEVALATVLVDVALPGDGRGCGGDRHCYDCLLLVARVTVGKLGNSDSPTIK